MKTFQLLSLIPAFVHSTGASHPFTTNTESGCDQSLPSEVRAGHSKNLTISSKSGVATRKYRLHLPPSYDISKRVPIIISFHGRGKDAKFQEKLSQFSNATYGYEGIAVYPEGVAVHVTATSR